MVNLKIKKMSESAEEVLRQFVLDFQAARDAIIQRIDEILNGSGDLTADEVRDLLTPIRDDLNNIGNPPV